MASGRSCSRCHGANQHRAGLAGRRALHGPGQSTWNQTLINDTLRHAIESERFVQDMRIAIRKELPSFPAVQK